MTRRMPKKGKRDGGELVSNIVASDEPSIDLP